MMKGRSQERKAHVASAIVRDGRGTLGAVRLIGDGAAGPRQRDPGAGGESTGERSTSAEKDSDRPPGPGRRRDRDTVTLIHPRRRLGALGQVRGRGPVRAVAVQGRIQAGSRLDLGGRRPGGRVGSGRAGADRRKVSLAGDRSRVEVEDAGGRIRRQAGIGQAEIGRAFQEPDRVVRLGKLVNSRGFSDAEPGIEPDTREERARGFSGTCPESLGLRRMPTNPGLSATAATRAQTPVFRAILVPTNPADINLQTDTVRGGFSAGREHRPRASSARSTTREDPRRRVASRRFGGRQGGYLPTGWGRDLATHAILVRRFSLVDGTRAPVAVFQPLRVTLVARVAARGNMPTRGERRAGPRRPEPDLRATKVTPRGGLGR